MKRRNSPSDRAAAPYIYIQLYRIVPFSAPSEEGMNLFYAGEKYTLITTYMIALKSPYTMACEKHGFETPGIVER